MACWLLNVTISFFRHLDRGGVEVRASVSFTGQTVSNAFLYNFKHVTRERKWLQVSNGTSTLVSSCNEECAVGPAVE